MLKISLVSARANGISVPKAHAKACAFRLPQTPPAPKVRKCELKKIKKKWKILKLGLDTGGYVMIGTQSLGKHYGLSAKEHPAKTERGAAWTTLL